MPVKITEVGIQQIDLTLLVQSSVEVVNEELEPLLNGDGTLADDPLETFNPELSFEFQGLGDLPAGLAAGGGLPNGGGHDEISGGVSFLERVREVENTDKRNEWSVSGINAPNATVAA